VTWCKHLHVKPDFPEQDDDAVLTAATDQRAVDIALQMLIYSEAGNFRFCPEFLCFLYHRMRRELAQQLATLGQSYQEGQRLPSSKEPLYFLTEIIRPLYLELKQRMCKKRPGGGGDLDAHSTRQNYDDFNEFFWTSGCLAKECVPENIIQLWQQGKKIAKTYIERRSVLSTFRNFGRIFHFNFVLFYVLVVSAVIRYGRNGQHRDKFFAFADDCYLDPKVTK